MSETDARSLAVAVSASLVGGMTIPDAFREQAAHCARLQAAFTQRLCEVLATGLAAEHPVERSILAWGSIRRGLPVTC